MAKPSRGPKARTPVAAIALALLLSASGCSDDDSSDVTAGSEPGAEVVLAGEADLDCAPDDRVVQYVGTAATDADGGTSPAQAISQWRRTVPSPAEIDGDAELGGERPQTGWYRIDRADGPVALFTQGGRAMSRVSLQESRGGWFVIEELTCNELLVGRVLTEDELIDPRVGE